jgi:hypothetical protein
MKAWILGLGVFILTGLAVPMAPSGRALAQRLDQQAPPSILDCGSAWKSTAGASLDLQELSRAPSRGGSTGVTYKAVTTGLPAGNPLALIVRRLKQGCQTYTTNALVDASGTLVGPSGRESHITLDEASKGEPFDIALVTLDGNTVGFAHVVPFPIKVTGPDKCEMDVELSSADGMAFLIRGAGYQPGETINVTDRSEDEVITDQITAQQDGTWLSIEFPAVVGKPSGNASYSASGQRCQLTLPFAWGSDALVVQ